MLYLNSPEDVLELCEMADLAMDDAMGTAGASAMVSIPKACAMSWMSLPSQLSIAKLFRRAHCCSRRGFDHARDGVGLTSRSLHADPAGYSGLHTPQTQPRHQRQSRRAAQHDGSGPAGPDSRGAACQADQAAAAAAALSSAGGTALAGAECAAGSTIAYSNMHSFLCFTVVYCYVCSCTYNVLKTLRPRLLGDS